MFVIKFPKNPLILKVKVNGPFISVYVPPEEVENFQHKYEKLLGNYSVLSIGEGPLHDFAHSSHNKHLSGFFRKSSHEHFHFILPKTANESNLAKFLNFLDDKDLSQEQKHQVLEGFKESNKVSLKSLLSKIKSYHYMLYSVDMRETQSLERMPLFAEFIDKLTPYLSKELDNSVNISPTSMIKIGDQFVSTLEAYNNLTSFFAHVKLLSNFQKLITKLLKNKEVAADAGIVTKLNELFNSAAKIPLTNFNKLSPALYKELKKQFPFIDDDFNNLYEALKQQLGDLLRTDKLIFTPPTSYSSEVGSSSGHTKQIEKSKKISQAKGNHDIDNKKETNQDKMDNIKTLASGSLLRSNSLEKKPKPNTPLDNLDSPNKNRP
ncbi:Uncharacterised protein [Legionella beliardensis]|uniref:Uncharacterized protein n=1 Tax=Legionella beliardensis TaxID=91822 RepID=A0A378JP60_9GAMM|nr:hypothetical protein [Legionella beliardensis]STX55675.1 Uncharacterised protein [Legionella beliardensis]